MHLVTRIHRIGCSFHERNWQLLAKLCWIINRVIFSCDIGVGAYIGENVDFYHNGLGVVVHPRARIGSGCSIYQNVTIGGNGKERSENGVPEIESDVFIGAGAIIIGPIKVGEHAVIGANSVINFDVPPNSVVAGNPAKVVRLKSSS